jgi:glycosyltransferase involved in cell wall biosynthesis
MTAVMPGFDLFVFPARYDYSPYAVIEAMTAGVPVLATRVGAIPEMVEDGVSGFLIDQPRAAPLAERMAWAVAHRACLPEMGSRARQRATGSYAADQNYPRLLDLLSAVRPCWWWWPP